MKKLLKLLRFKVLDAYIIQKYLGTFFFTMMIFTMLSMAFDFSDKIQTFIEGPVTLKNILIDYYPGFVLHISGLIMPIYTMIAVVFFTSRLAFNAEILSILNAGVSFQRLLRPYLIAGGFIALFHLSLSHFLIPQFNKSRLWFEHTFVWKDQLKVKNSSVHVLLAPDTKAFIRSYNKDEMKISGLRLEHFEGRIVSSILEAENAIWKPELKKWQLQNYRIRNIDGLRESLQQPRGPIDTTLNLFPEDFVYYHNQNEEMTTPELYAAIRRDESRGLTTSSKAYRIEMSRRTADAFTNLILTIIGLALAGRKSRGGMGLHLALAIGIGCAFVLLSKFSNSFAAGGVLAPEVAMWIPNMVFMLIALYLAMRAQK